MSTGTYMLEDTTKQYPDIIRPCAGTIFAVVQYIGTATINGSIYDYDAANDSLVKRKPQPAKRKGTS